MLRRVLGLVLVFAVLALGLPADAAWAQEEDVDLLLVLAADISRSLDHQKFRLQRDGYAAAISDARVVKAMTAGPKGRIALMFFEWSSEGDHTVIVDWTTIGGPEDAARAAATVRDAPRMFMGRTSISHAIEVSLQQLRRSPFAAPRRVIDISGDGTNNSGPDVQEVRDKAVEQGVVINGLVILSDVPLSFNPSHTHPPGGLTHYYETNVIGGVGSFVVEAKNFESFGQSLISKLIKEVAGTPRGFASVPAATTIAASMPGMRRHTSCNSMSRACLQQTATSCFSARSCLAPSP